MQNEDQEYLIIPVPPNTIRPLIKLDKHIIEWMHINQTSLLIETPIGTVKLSLVPIDREKE